MKKILRKLGKFLQESNEKESGFTLIDVMVTMALFALITSVLLANYPDSATKVELANAVSDIQGIARDSQLKAGGIETAGDTAAGYGLYFDAASTTKFVQFKDLQIGSSTDLSGGAIGDNVFDAATEVSKIVTIPSGFYLRNICVGDGTARPFATSSCSRTQPTLGTVTVSYARLMTQPIIYINNATSTHYAAVCVEFASVNSIAAGKVRNMIISQSGFSTTALGACDEEPINLALNTSPNTGAGSLITSGNTSTFFGIDNTAPVITLISGSPLEMYLGDPVTDPGATALDNVDGNISSKINSAFISMTNTATQKTIYQFGIADTNPYFSKTTAAGDTYFVLPNRIGKIAIDGTVTKYADNFLGQSAIALDSSGNVYTANSNSNNVTKITPAGVSSLLGTTGDPSILGSSGGSPNSITLDSAGNVYTQNNGSDISSGKVSKITPAGVSSILGTTGSFSIGTTIDSAGNIYTANSGSNNVTKITPAGVSSILGTTGGRPYAITIDSSGNVYTANSNSNNVTKITPAGVSSILGTTGTSPYAITLDSAGNVYTANNNSNNVTKITPAGVSSILGSTGVSSIQGSSGIYSAGIISDSLGNIYTANNIPNNVTKTTSAGVTSVLGTTGTSPHGITIDSAGNVYTANYYSNNVTKITPSGVPSILGTTGTNPHGITIDSAGNVYTANNGSNDVSKITPAGVSSILGTTGTSPRAITIDSAGNVYTANYTSNNVTKITPAGVSSILGTTGTSPVSISVDSAGNVYTVNNGSNDITKITPSGVSTLIGTPGSVVSGQSISVDSAGNVYAGGYNSIVEIYPTAQTTSPVSVTQIASIVSDGDNYLKRYSVRDFAGNISTINRNFSFISSKLITSFPISTNVSHFDVDSQGNVYIPNSASNNVTKITPAGVSSILGTTGTSPYGITIDSAGNVYTGNLGAGNISKITPAGVSSILGNNGLAPYDISVDSAGNVYAVNQDNGNVTKITPAGVSSILGTTGTSPFAVIIDSADNVYIANYGSSNVNKITPAGVSSILGTTGIKPIAITVDSAGNVYTVNSVSQNTTKITPAGISYTIYTSSKVLNSLKYHAGGMTGNYLYVSDASPSILKLQIHK